MHKFNIKSLDKLDNPKRRQLMPPIETLKKFQLGDKGTLLDIGCGIGYFSIPAANILNQGKVIGLDIMPEMIDIAKEKAKNIANIKFIKCEEYSFPIQDASIDYVFISNVIHEIENKAKYFNEIRRVLKPGGLLCIIDWEKKETEMGPSINDRISKEEMIKICASANFAHLEDVFINMDHYGLKFKLI
ncbi:class I SAM-dependent methyltransferase [Clostridium estertheticum]|uniref:class I SAM-dependent methyltransferase n=1 Tax=Clostridium estertheticum TaxID=238834 RepID=UPI001C6E594E|nr:class I SAM-dependent methyltransferase [Clostridium estertheticum]MBW9150719.1 class I SAM-dependent methyltransferase [Clostridium estertheticum]WLC84547.1 class I SAM-dependent methyltransferase [Clostridium estertheticum]